MSRIPWRSAAPQILFAEDRLRQVHLDLKSFEISNGHWSVTPCKNRWTSQLTDLTNKRIQEKYKKARIKEVGEKK